MYRSYFLEIIAATYARLKHIRSLYGETVKYKNDDAHAVAPSFLFLP